MLQSGQFVNFTNNQNTLGGQLRLDEKTLPGNSHRLTGTVELCVRRQVAPPRRDRDSGRQGIDHRNASAGCRSPPSFTSAPPAPGAAAPRTPKNIQGTYALSPSSTCFGSSFSIHGTGSVAQLYSSSDKLLGPVTYSTKTAGVFGDVKCVKGGLARMTATANDLQLQKVTVIPLNVATPVPSTASTAKPALTTPSGTVAGGREVHRDQAAL